MRHFGHPVRWAILLLFIIAGLQLVACGQPSTTASGGEEPAKVDPVAGTDLSRVIVTEEAAKRLDIQTATVHDAQMRGTLRLVAPYSAVLYDMNGATWVYTNPSPLTFVRESITVEYIEGDLAVLAAGPPAGTVVVTVAGPELYGIEAGVGE
ncbi:MAG: hypothetical protein OJF49_002801 [Ktedonobacterales bacterium]|jgi:hypothetical protein|nr:MAG: hypothetical protein OJF49_002801 [Ktedonobacterales bacterium]